MRNQLHYQQREEANLQHFIFLSFENDSCSLAVRYGTHCLHTRKDDPLDSTLTSTLKFSAVEAALLLAPDSTLSAHSRPQHTMQARLLIRSALSTKPNFAGATSGWLFGTVTPCTQHPRKQA